MEREAVLRAQLAAAGLPVADAPIPRLLWLLDELLRWNRRINLTAITDPLAGIEKHLVDSLTPLSLLTGRERLLDLGSGAGFPCLPLKIARPGLQVVSIESVGKKVAFQRHVIRQLGLDGMEALAQRAEKAVSRNDLTGTFDVVVARAFASLTDFAALALPFLAPDGFLLAMKGAEGERELAAAGDRLGRLGLVAGGRHRLRLPASGAERILLVLRPGAGAGENGPAERG